jgi:hypothetical protein
MPPETFGQLYDDEKISEMNQSANRKQGEPLGTFPSNISAKYQA